MFVVYLLDFVIQGGDPTGTGQGYCNWNYSPLGSYKL